MDEINDVRQERKKETAEVFTPGQLVDEILNQLPSSVWKEEKTFIDPACGNGNFLLAVLSRKLALGHDPIKAIKSIYGTDIMQDNIDECRLRLLSLLEEKGIKVDKIICGLVASNIKWLDTKKYPEGSLSYLFSFNISKEELEKQSTNLLTTYQNNLT